MNNSTVAELIAEEMNSTIAGLEVLPMGSSEELNKPGAVVEAADFEEDFTLLGSYEGEITVRVRTVPDDTNLATHRALVDDVSDLLCDLVFLDAALSGAFEVPEVWDLTASIAPDDGIRETTITIQACLVQLA